MLPDTQPGPGAKVPHRSNSLPGVGSIEPEVDQFRALVAAAEAPGGDDAPIMMINLLRFAEQATYPEGFDAEPCTGAEAYARYGAAAQEFLEKVGGRPIWAAPAHETIIGPLGEDWDVAFGVRYPSRKAFLAMATDEGYLAIVPHRTAALADSRLIMCDVPSENAPDVFGLG
jgi:uncharacterized protein (DUF1330 family)